MVMNSVLHIPLTFCLVLLLCVCCLANDRVSIVMYQVENGQGIDQFRENLEEFANELNRNGTINPCPRYGRICSTTEKCTKYLQQESDAGQTMCSILVYSPTTPPTFDVMPDTRDYSNGLILQPNKNDGMDFGEITESPPTLKHPSAAEVWGFGVLAVAIISLSGLFGAVFWPLMKTTFYTQMMWVLIGLAVGSLTASATFQLIPEGFKLKEHDENYLNTALFMWVSFWALYMFEALSKIFLHSEPEVTSNMELHVPRTQNCAATVTEQSYQEQLEIKSLLPALATKDENTNKNLNLAETKSIPLYMSQGSLHNLTFQKTAHLHSHGREDNSPDKKMATVAWMIIIGDGIHNFIDGMSIGAGFSKSIAVGTSISIAIACEEFPHELGDFAILINSGMSVKRALLFNFLSACTAFAGLVLGILLGEIDASVYIFAFAGGLFLYIALTDLMPELNEMIAAGLKKGKKYALFVLLLQNFGIFLGASILYAVTVLPINIT